MTGTLRNWIMKHPRPAAIRISRDGQSQLISIPVKVIWAEIAETVEALDPDLIELLAADGSILRVDKALPADPRPPAPVELNSFARRPPKPVEGAARNDQAIEHMTAVSEIIAAAYKHSTEVAFARMVDLFEAVNRRSEALERSLDLTHSLLRKSYEDQLETAIEAASAQVPPATDPMAQMAQAFLGGAMQNKVRPITAPTTNGAVPGPVKAGTS